MATKKRPKRSLTGRIVSIIGRIVFLMVLAGLVMVILGMKNLYDSFALVRTELEKVVDIGIPGSSQATRVYARDYDPATETGTLLATLYMENRSNAEYFEIPAEFLACLISMEDHRFFEHNGVDIMGLGRAVVKGLLRGGDIKATSTITQQLARNLFMSKEERERKTYSRKVQEAIFALALEKRLSKQEILTYYLNHIYLGGGAHGLKAAARTYFGKDLDELTLGECAMIAGLPQTPAANNPYSNPEAAERKRRVVLNLLDSRLDEDYVNYLIDADSDKFGDLHLTHEDIEQALGQPIETTNEVRSSGMLAPYFTSFVRHHILYPQFGEDLVLRDGLVVVTTLDPLYQDWAEAALAEGIDEDREKKRVSQGALVLVEAKTGEVLACVGGYKWGDPGKDGMPDKYNRALLGGRPVGSSFKPFTYATAYEQGFPVNMTIWDGPQKDLSEKLKKEWPQNSDKTYRGWISTFYALQYSRNAASVDLLINCTGIRPVIETARKMGITAQLDEVPALTLGVSDIKPIEMAEAFATFPNMGKHVDTILVRQVYSDDGLLIQDNTAPGQLESRTNRAFSENTAWMMVQNMRRVVEAGTGTNARVSGVEIGGKTGTNDDFADAWFVGYTPELACAVWLGNDDYGLQMKRMFGGDQPAKTFSRLLKKIYRKQTETIGEGDDAQEAVTYEPLYTSFRFNKPDGATFNGFPAAQVGQKMERDEEGNLILPEPEPEEGEDDGSSPGEEENKDDEFYNQWDPPPGDHVFF